MLFNSVFTILWDFNIQCRVCYTACSVNRRETVSLFKFPIKSLMIPFELNWPVSLITIYIYYMLSLHIGGGCGQINLNYEHKPSYLIFYILTDEIWDQTGVCVRLCEWRQQRAPPWMNEHREGCNSSQPLPFCLTAVRELKVNIWDRRMRLEMSVFLSSCNALFYSWINFLRVPGHLIAITYSIISVTVSRTKLNCSN